jgi:Ni/Co efflux regulator RcnB
VSVREIFATLDLQFRQVLAYEIRTYIMKTKLILAMSAALLFSTAAVLAQSYPPSGDAAVQTTKTTTTTTVQHVDGANATWYKTGGVVPTEYRDSRYVVTHYQTEHLNDPTDGTHWVRGDNGDFLLVDENTGVIVKIIQNPQH